MKSPRGLLVVAVVLGGFVFLGHGWQAATMRREKLKTQLAHERLIRIVEPAIFPLQRLSTDDTPIWGEIYESCGISPEGVASRTELGEVWLQCEPQPRSTPINAVLNLPLGLYDDRVTKVAVKGFNTHEHLCPPHLDNGIQDNESYTCFQNGKPTGKPVPVVVIARFTITTNKAQVTMSPVIYEFPE